MIAPLVHSALSRRGERPTVVGADGQWLSGHRLNAAASALAERLAGEGIGTGDTVAVAASASGDVEQAVGLVAGLYADADFVFIDSALPSSRAAEFVDAVQPACIVGTAAEVFEHGGRLGLKALPAETDGTVAASPVDLPHTPSGYRVQTSGTTGRPKALRISGAALENRLRWGQSVYSLGLDDVVLSTSQPGFDFYVWEFLAPLCFGAKLVLSTGLESVDAAALAKRCAAERATALHFFPRLLDEFSDHVAGTSGAETLRWVFSGGAPLDGATLDKARSAMPAAAVFNQYGPAECCIDVSFMDCAEWSGTERSGTVPIGRAIDNTTLEVVDPMLYPVSPGTVGEILVGGIAAATTEVLSGRGPEDESFTTLHRGGEGRAVYRTGDFGYVDESGLVHFVGRRDTQYKVHGARVDLAEVERSVRALEGVADCHVYPAEDGRGDVAIGAVVESRDLTERECRRRLAAAVPLYAVPTRLHVRPSLPRTPKGQIDTAKVLDELGERTLDRKRSAGRTAKTDREERGTARTVPGGAEIRPTSLEEQRLIGMRGVGGRPLTLTVANQLRVRGTLDLERLGAAFRELVARHSILRTTYASHDGGLAAVVHRLPAPDVFEARAVAGTRDEAAIRRFISEERLRVLDGFRDPDRHSMLRAVVYCHGKDLFTLLILVDHIAIDERSKGVLQHELALLYEGRADLLEPAPQYDPDRIRRDFPDPREVPAIVETLTPLPPRILPSPDPAAAPEELTADTVEVEFGSDVSNGISEATKRFRCTRFEFLLAVFFRALKTYAGSDDVALVAAVDTRKDPQDFGTMGFFQNLVLLRSRTPGSEGLEQLISESRGVVRSALAHRDHPVTDIVEAFRDRGIGENRCNPIWQIAFMYTADDPEKNWRLGDADVVDVPFHSDHATLELSLNVVETENSVKGVMVFAAGALSRADAQRLMGLWEEALGSTLAVGTE